MAVRSRTLAAGNFSSAGGGGFTYTVPAFRTARTSLVTLVNTAAGGAPSATYAMTLTVSGQQRFLRQNEGVAVGAFVWLPYVLVINPGDSLGFQGTPVGGPFLSTWHVHVFGSLLEGAPS